MSVRIGFTRFRQRALQAELDRIAPQFPQLGVQQAILIGDMAAGEVGPESSLDLIMVMEMPGKFVRRMDFFISHLHPEIASNFLVYTPEEFFTLRETSPFLANALKKGKVIHES